MESTGLHINMGKKKLMTKGWNVLKDSGSTPVAYAGQGLEATQSSIRAAHTDLQWYLW